MIKLFWLPGYIVIAMMYFLPIESGKKRNVSRSARWWNHKNKMAPIISICIYLALAIYIYYPNISQLI